MSAVLDNAREAVERDPVRLASETAERQASRRLHRAVLLAPSVEVLEALLQGEPVPVDVLDAEQLARFLPPEVDAPEEGAPSSSVQPGASTAVRLDDLPSVAAGAPGVERVRLARVPLDAAADDLPDARDNVEEKARRLLAEGRVRVTAVHGDRLEAVVQGDHASYAVRLTSRGPSCPCEAYVRRCSHVRAVELVTGTRPEVEA